MSQNAVIDALQTMTLRPQDQWLLDDPRVFEKIMLQAWIFPCFVLPSPERPLAVVGLCHEFGVGTVWMVTGEGFGTEAKTILRQSRELIDMGVSSFGLHRTFMEVDAERRDAKRWAKLVGFEYETTLKRAGVRGNDLEIWLWPNWKGKEIS